MAKWLDRTLATKRGQLLFQDCKIGCNNKFFALHLYFETDGSSLAIHAQLNYARDLKRGGLGMLGATHADRFEAAFERLHRARKMRLNMPPIQLP